MLTTTMVLELLIFVAVTFTSLENEEKVMQRIRMINKNGILTFVSVVYHYLIVFC